MDSHFNFALTLSDIGRQEFHKGKFSQIVTFLEFIWLEFTINNGQFLINVNTLLQCIPISFWSYVDYDPFFKEKSLTLKYNFFLYFATKVRFFWLKIIKFYIFLSGFDTKCVLEESKVNNDILKINFWILWNLWIFTFSAFARSDFPTPCLLFRGF